MRSISILLVLICRGAPDRVDQGSPEILRTTDCLTPAVAHRRNRIRHRHGPGPRSSGRPQPRTQPHPRHRTRDLVRHEDRRSPTVDLAIVAFREGQAWTGWGLAAAVATQLNGPTV